MARLYQKTLFWRWASIILKGFFLRLLLDLIFKLIYRNYEIVWVNYIGAMLLAAVIVEGMRWINKGLDRQHPWEGDTQRRFFIQAGTNMLFALFVMLVLRLLIVQRLIYPYEFIKLSDELITHALVLFAVLIATLVDLGLFLLNKWRFSLAELERFKKENIEFHFEMLKNQVNPHFLFNSLNTLSSLIYSNQDTAARFVRQLARVYRYVLENRDKEVISLKEELNFLQSFIYLVHLRFSENLKVEINIPETMQEKLIAPMTLQMLIENAIKHNVVSQKKPLTIQIYADMFDHITVTNNLQKKEVREYSSNIGLKNISSRYGFITERKVIVEENPDYFKVRIPLLEKVYEMSMFSQTPNGKNKKADASSI
jgi:two-component system, LytTR family, sensor kinase